MKKKNTPQFENYAKDPFSLLGVKHAKGQIEITVYSPHTISINIDSARNAMSRMGKSDYFCWSGKPDQIDKHHTLHIKYDNADTLAIIDPYTFHHLIPEYDLHIFSQGNHWSIYDHLGANEKTIDGINGVLFAVWAPNARRMSVVGNFNLWNGKRHPMQNYNGTWALFIPGIAHGELYKFEIVDYNNKLKLKTDPYGKHFELRPATSAIVEKNSEFEWQDDLWREHQKSTNINHQPLSIYEVHLGSWKRNYENHFINYKTLAHELVDYVKQLNFTHVELLPITEHPLDASWGYQTLGYYAPTSRFGTPDDFRYFVNHCHKNEIGVILDWVPAHFPTDDHGLARFDGTALYEHEDPKKGEHRDWGTYIFNYGRAEVNNFLIANALFWLKEYHLDGLRVDAVASMLYLDYSREEDDWIPNEFGGNENFEAINFIKHLTSVTLSQHPNAILMAEESTSWPGVTQPTDNNGLGFNLKWNLGWMHDILEYFQFDPIHRAHHHDKLTFGLLYTFSEKFILPLSHDEIVHGKRSLVQKMSGDDWQKFANLKTLYTFMFTYPGKKLLFMGNEMAQTTEWDHDHSLPWYLLEYHRHHGVQKLVQDLNHLYINKSELHHYDFEEQGFHWIDCDDKDHSIISYIRKHGGKILIIVLNFTPIPRYNYLVESPGAGKFVEIFNSDSRFYNGEDIGNHGIISAVANAESHWPYTLSINLPPLAGLIFEPYFD